MNIHASKARLSLSILIASQICIISCHETEAPNAPNTPPNTAPTVANVVVTGTAKVGQQLSASYSYSDVEGDTEAQSTFQWYEATSTAGNGESAIAGATDIKYIIPDDKKDKFVRVGVTPVASSGTKVGVEAKSNFTSVILEETDVTFTYNGKQVTYNVIKSPVTGRKWLDRNLGAANAATAYNDWANYGDLFQWGRAADGHQLVTRTGALATQATVTSTTATKVSTDNPGHALFITSAAAGEPIDWRSPQNNNLWQGVNGINNPCPSGWRIPTDPEWLAEQLNTSAIAYSNLKLTLTGGRANDGVFFASQGTRYWSSSIATLPVDPGSGSSRFLLEPGATPTMFPANRAFGYACRCIKN